MADFYLAQGDLLPALRVVCMEPDPVTGLLRPADLTDCSVVLRLTRVGCDLPLLGGTAAIVGDPREGEVSYSWIAADSAHAGQYYAKVIATHTSSGKRRSFPNNRYLAVEILRDL